MCSYPSFNHFLSFNFKVSTDMSLYNKERRKQILNCLHRGKKLCSFSSSVQAQQGVEEQQPGKCEQTEPVALALKNHEEFGHVDSLQKL